MRWRSFFIGALGLLQFGYWYYVSTHILQITEDIQEINPLGKIFGTGNLLLFLAGAVILVIFFDKRKRIPQAFLLYVIASVSVGIWFGVYMIPQHKLMYNLLSWDFFYLVVLCAFPLVTAWWCLLRAIVPTMFTFTIPDFSRMQPSRN